MLDSLEAKIMSLQVVASENGLHRLTDALDEVLAYVRQILSAEVLAQGTRRDPSAWFGQCGTAL